MAGGGALTTEDRAAVVAAVLGAGAEAVEVLALLAPPRGERCAAEAKRLLALAGEARARAVADEVAALLRPAPANLHLVHESWIEARLAGEGEAVRAALAGGGGAAPAVRAWLERRVTGDLVAMPDDPADVAAAPPERLVGAIETLGRRRLALALKAAPPAAAALAASLGPAHGRLFVDEARRPAPKEQIGAAVRELADLVAGTAPLLLFRAGARHLAPALAAAGGDAARQLAQRLPRDRGLALLDEAARAAPGAPGALEALRELLR